MNSKIDNAIRDAAMRCGRDSGERLKFQDDKKERMEIQHKTGGICTLHGRVLSFLYRYIIKSSLFISANIASLTLLVQVVLFHQTDVAVAMDAPAKAWTGIRPFEANKLGFQLDWAPFFLVFFEALVIYTTDHIRDSVNTKQKREAQPIQWMKFLRLVGLVGMAMVLLLRRSIGGVALVVGHLGLGVLYAKPIFWHHRHCQRQEIATSEMKNGDDFINSTDGSNAFFLCADKATCFRLKDIPYFKSIFVSLCVTFMVVACPFVLDRGATTEQFVPGKLWKMGVQRQPLLFGQLCFTIFTMQITMENLQDMRDVKEDRRSGTKTLPVGMGLRQTKLLLLSCYVMVGIILHTLPAMFDWYRGPHGSLIFAMFLVLVLVIGIGNRTGNIVFSYIEVMLSLPLLVHWVMSGWLGIDPFLAPPSEADPCPWHLPVMVTLFMSINHCYSWYLNSQHDTCDQKLPPVMVGVGHSRQRPGGRDGTTVLACAGALSSAVCLAQMIVAWQRLWQFVDNPKILVMLVVLLCHLASQAVLGYRVTKKNLN